MGKPNILFDGRVTGSLMTHGSQKVTCGMLGERLGNLKGNDYCGNPGKFGLRMCILFLYFMLGVKGRCI